MRVTPITASHLTKRATLCKDDSADNARLRTVVMPATARTPVPFGRRGQEECASGLPSESLQWSELRGLRLARPTRSITLHDGKCLQVDRQCFQQRCAN